MLSHTRAIESYHGCMCISHIISRMKMERYFIYRKDPRFPTLISGLTSWRARSVARYDIFTDGCCSIIIPHKLISIDSSICSILYLDAHATDGRSPRDARRLKNDCTARELSSINIERIARLLARPLFHMQSQLPDTGRICL